MIVVDMATSVDESRQTSKSRARPWVLASRDGNPYFDVPGPVRDRRTHPGQILWPKLFRVLHRAFANHTARFAAMTDLGRWYRDALSAERRLWITARRERRHSS